MTSEDQPFGKSTVRRTIDRDMVNTSAMFSVSQSLVYLNNPKAGCSTIKTSMWKACDAAAGVTTFPGNPHFREHDPFIKDLFRRGTYNAAALKTATFFSVVRNPFVRILSAYFNKIVSRAPGVWPTFSRRFGVRNDIGKNDLTFRDFLVMLTTEPDELLDPHFRPQYLNLLLPMCRPHFIGHMENMSEVQAFLEPHKVELERFGKPAPRSRERVESQYVGETIDLVREKYATDFELFGYSTDVADVAEFTAVKFDTTGRELLTPWIVENEFPYELVDNPTQRFERFRAMTSRGQAKANREAKVAAASEASRTDDSWSRLQAYAAFAINSGEYALAQQIIARIVELCGTHYSQVRNPTIFFNRSNTAPIPLARA
jgi:hypothetical protein